MSQLAMTDTLMARQPIYDRNNNIYAYELLFRNSETDLHANFHSGDKATMATQAQHNNRAHRAHYRVVFITVMATLGLVALGHDTPARVFAGWGLTGATVLAILLTYRPMFRFLPRTRDARRGGRDRGNA